MFSKNKVSGGLQNHDGAGGTCLLELPALKKVGPGSQLYLWHAQNDLGG